MIIKTTEDIVYETLFKDKLLKKEASKKWVFVDSLKKELEKFIIYYEFEWHEGNPLSPNEIRVKFRDLFGEATTKGKVK